MDNVFESYLRSLLHKLQLEKLDGAKEMAQQLEYLTHKHRA